MPPYVMLGIDLLALQRFDEARLILQQALGRRDFGEIYVSLYGLAFVVGDARAMAEQQQWLAGRPEYENSGLSLASDTEAYRGHLDKARELTKRAVDSA